MELFNTTKKLSLTLVGLSYLCTVHAADITTIAADFIKTITTDVTKTATDAIESVVGAIIIDDKDCGRNFSKSGKIYVLGQNMECSEGQGAFALQFSGDHSFIFLNEHSITAVDPEPGTGILITGNKNYVIGPGTVEGYGVNFISEGNIVIENVAGNHVSELTLNKGVHGVLIKAFDGGSAQENHISHNHVQDAEIIGIAVLSDDNSSADANQIHDNDIQNVGVIGIDVFSFGDNSSADANQVYDNRLQDVGFFGIIVQGGIDSSADANQIHDNHIHDTAVGISIQGTGDNSNSSANENQVISNHIIHPQETAIMLGILTSNNLITHNFTKKPGAGSAYCDETVPFNNNWGVNFIKFMAPVEGFPGAC